MTLPESAIRAAKRLLSLVPGTHLVTVVIDTEGIKYLSVLGSGKTENVRPEGDALTESAKAK